ncbi:E3 ubiquitin-protein ligase RLIM-like [Zingiber officinale]|uniref:RING-type domain-containing protein n=1 Tax=Zingiber officinale TaxID=94328 RepID=A0A8J5LDG7_ZINOF|nr:E3 ubiquitin-protein ligase RLIM-like [Zingiber officinale]XP_042462179.1 E3 ubiquitin-protein ligase RLIM-like [Zingiber officinale]KAG6524248.1 hypothetical protein ZIOFF_014154 [Zingiber officinale]
MGGNCSVAVKDKHLPNPAQLDVPLSTCRNARYSPSWSFRCDNRTHIEVVMDSSPQISHHPNSGNEVKSEFLLTEAERLSETAGPSTAFQLQKGETPIKNGSSRMATHDSAVDQANGSTSSPKRKNSSPKPSLLAPSASDTIITFSVPSTPSPSHKAGSSSSRSRQVPSGPTSSKKAACRSPDSRIPSVQSLKEDNSPEGRQSFALSVGGSHGGSSNGWSMQTFSELVASSNRERWSFENDNLTPSSTTISSSNDHQQTCRICSTPLTDYCIVAVLVCGHLYHAGCLEKMTSEIDQYDPPCPLCTHGQKSAVKLFKKSEAKAKNRSSRVGAADDGKTLLYDGQKAAGVGLRNGASSSTKFPFNLKRYFSFSRPSRSKSENESKRMKGFWRRSSRS